MKKTPHASVADFLAQLSPERRAVLSKMRALIRKNLPAGYEEAFNWGAITYQVPLKRLSNTYNGQPLCYVALSSQKEHASLYLMTTYGDASKKKQLEGAFRNAGKKLHMGKACIRFRDLDDLPLDGIADIIASTSVDAYIAAYEKRRKGRG